MTGYGQAEGEVNGVTYVVEIKTVNNRYFKSVIRLPEAAAFVEEDIERLLRNSLSRGTVNCVLRLKGAAADVLLNVDETALRAIVEKLGRVASSADIQYQIDVGSLLNVPGILAPAPPDEEAARQIKEGVLGLTQEAVEKLKQMRAAEGAAVAADLDGHCKAIKQNLEQISARNVVVLQEYGEKLKKKVDELLAEAKLELDEETVAREVAIFAEKSDISEEVARLEYHLEQFGESCKGKRTSADAQVGRRLEFISQEMLREANTIASKACDSEIGHFVVEIKCRIDRIKEQVQNVE
jgi:uncharacterized protein (TIGR00255 family)